MPEMLIDIQDDGLKLAGHSIPWPQLFEAHALFYRKDPRTRKLESMGYDLASRSFPPQGIAEFVKRVCNWGGYAGVAGRVLKHNTIERIRSAFLVAMDALQTPNCAQSKALTAINGLYGLGTPSFASKHLRMAWPDQCVVLDSKLNTALDVRNNAVGYQQFCRICIEAAVRANAWIDVREHRPTDWPGPLRAADIEAAIFEYVSGGAYRITRA